MHPGSRGIRVLTPVTVMCAVVSVSLAWALPAHAQPAGVTINPPNPVAGDTVKANGPARECVSNAAGTYTFTFTRHNSDGSQTVTASGSGTSDNTLGGLDYSATLSQEGAYTIKEDAYCRPTMTMCCGPLTSRSGQGSAAAFRCLQTRLSSTSRRTCGAGGREPGLLVFVGSQQRRDLRRRGHAQPHHYVHDDRLARRQGEDHRQRPAQSSSRIRRRSLAR